MQRRAEQALVPRERAFRLPALAVLAAVEATLHLAAILGRRLSLLLAAAVERNDRRANLQVFAAESMILLAVESRVAQDAIEAKHEPRFSHGRAELRRIVAGPRADGGRG